MTPDDAGTDGRFDSGAWARIQAVEAWGHGLVGFFNPQFLIQFVDATVEGCDLVRIALDLINTRFLMNKEGT